MSDLQIVAFYHVNDNYGEFSNFAAFPITLKGKRWPTSEHYFQAQKFENTAYQEQIRQAKTPMIAARLGRNRKQKLRRDWEMVKDDIMREAVKAKFSQHAMLQELLFTTGKTKLVEHTVKRGLSPQPRVESPESRESEVSTAGDNTRVLTS